MEEAKEQTTVYLTRSQKEFLKKRSEKTGIPQAVMIRNAINEYMKKLKGE